MRERDLSEQAKRRRVSASGCVPVRSGTQDSLACRIDLLNIDARPLSKPSQFCGMNLFGFPSLTRDNSLPQPGANAYPNLAPMASAAMPHPFSERLAR